MVASVADQAFQRPKKLTGQGVFDASDYTSFPIT